MLHQDIPRVNYKEKSLYTHKFLTRRQWKNKLTLQSVQSWLRKDKSSSLSYIIHLHEKISSHLHVKARFLVL